MALYHCECDYDAAGNRRHLCETCAWVRRMELEREERIRVLEAALRRLLAFVDFHHERGRLRIVAGETPDLGALDAARAALRTEKDG